MYSSGVMLGGDTQRYGDRGSRPHFVSGWRVTYRSRKKLVLVQYSSASVTSHSRREIPPLSASPEELMEATAATLRLSNQNNGIRGSITHCSAMEGPYCPVKALVRRFVHLRTNNAAPNEILSAFWDHLGVNHVTDNHMRKTIKEAVMTLKLNKQGFSETRARTHSLRAGGGQCL